MVLHFIAAGVPETPVTSTFPFARNAEKTKRKSREAEKIANLTHHLFFRGRQREDDGTRVRPRQRHPHHRHGDHPHVALRELLLQ